MIDPGGKQVVKPYTTMYPDGHGCSQALRDHSQQICPTQPGLLVPGFGTMGCRLEATPGNGRAAELSLYHSIPIMRFVLAT